MSKPKHEIGWKATLVALYLFVQPFGAHAIEPGEIGIEHDAVATHEEDARGDLLDGNNGSFLGAGFLAILLPSAT